MTRGVLPRTATSRPGSAAPKPSWSRAGIRQDQPLENPALCPASLPSYPQSPPARPADTRAPGCRRQRGTAVQPRAPNRIAALLAPSQGASVFSSAKWRRSIRQDPRSGQWFMLILAVLIRGTVGVAGEFSKTSGYRSLHTLLWGSSHSALTRHREARTLMGLFLGLKVGPSHPRVSPEHVKDAIPWLLPPSPSCK